MTLCGLGNWARGVTGFSPPYTTFPVTRLKYDIAEVMNVIYALSLATEVQL